MNYNKLTVRIYEQNSLTLVNDPLNELERVQEIKKDTRFPYGLYGSASFKLKRNVTKPWPWRGGHRVVIRNGLRTVYEGVLASVNIYNEEAEQGLVFTAYGAWGQILEKWTINKRWADNRLGEDAWRVDTSATNTAQELVSIDREGRLRFSPSQNDFTASHLASLYYNMPTGQTIKRVALSRDFSERHTTRPGAAKLATFSGFDNPKSVKHAIFDGYEPATKVFSKSGSTYTDRANTYDGSSGTSDTFTLGGGDSLYIRCHDTFEYLRMNLGPTFNTNVRTITVNVSVGGVLTAVTGLSDGTSSGGVTFAQDGIIFWTAPEAWEETTINGFRGFWAVIQPSAALTSCQFVEIEVEDAEDFSYTTLTNAFDGSAVTTVTASIAINDRVYVCYQIKHGTVKIDFGGTVNAIASVLSANYWQEETVQSGGLQLANWQTLAITDGTAAAGKTFAQDGSITFTAPVDWIETTVNGVRGYWVRFSFSAALTASVVFNEVYCQNDDVYDFTDLPAAIDGDISTSESITLTTEKFLYVKGDPVNWGFVSFDFGITVNSVAANMVAAYYQAEQTASTGLIPAAWASLTIITDGTQSGGATWRQDGDMVFTLPSDAQEITIDGERGLWLRFYPDTDLDPGITVKEIYNGITQAWELRLRDRTGAANIWSVTATGTGSQDDTLGTPRQRLDLEYLSKALQAGESNGTLYGQVTVPIVYGMTGSINVATIASDIISTVTDLNSSTVYLTTPGSPLTLMPFFTVGSEPAGSILGRAAAYGDTSFAQWYFQLLASDLAPTPDGKPVLKLAQFPDVTANYDYQIAIDAPTLKSLAVTIDYDNVANYIKVTYTDSDGIQQELTPADDSALTDTTSVTKYGRRDLIAGLGEATSTTALNYGKRILATRKDPRVIVSQPIPIVGYCLDRYGLPVPASEIEAGKRLRIINYLDDVIGTAGAGFTAIISDVGYDDNTQTAMASFGLWDDLAVLLAQRSLLNDENFNF